MKLMLRQYSPVVAELIRQLQERDREWQAGFRALETSSNTTLLSNVWVTPEDYDAVGNGSANDTAALQKAINENSGRILLLRGHYRVRATIIIPATIELLCVPGAIIETAASNVHVIRITGNDVTISGLTVRGNLTGEGGSVNANTGGDGIAISANVRGTRILRCRFERIGLSDDPSFASPIHGDGIERTVIADNYFPTGSRNETGADILVSGNNLTIKDNISESDCDSFISTGGTGLRHAISGNIGIRAPGATSRSGILALYSETPKQSSITNNFIQGFAWHGIYPTTSLTATPTDEWGGFTMTGNHVYYCGGGNSGDTSFITGAIRTAGIRGCNIGNNVVAYAGYESDGTPRTTLDVAGILVFQATANAHVHHNTVRHCRQNGISLRATSTGQWIRNVIVDHNVVDQNTGHGIAVLPQVSSSECITDVTIAQNIVTVTGETSSGIALAAINGSWANRVDMLGNQCTHRDPPAGGFVGGIHRDGHSDYTRNTGKVVGNFVKGFRHGFTIPYTLSMYCPFAVFVEGNTIEDANLGMAIGGGAVHWGIHINTTARNVTSISPSRSRSGRMLAAFSSGRRPVEMDQSDIGNGIPVDGPWIVGDRIRLLTKGGPVVGYECTAAGSVGTWVPIYESSAKYVATATPGLTSTTLTAVGTSAWTATGTATAASYAATNRYTRMSRVEYLETTPSTSAVAGVRCAEATWTHTVGYYVRMSWGPSTGVSTSTGRAFCGLVASTSAPTDVEPSSLVSMLGMGWDASDTNVQVFHNDSGGTAAKEDLGASFPVPTSDNTQVYTLELIVTSALVRYTVTNETTGALARGSFNTEVPSVPLAPQCWSSVGGTSSVIGIGFGGFYGERSY